MEYARVKIAGRNYQELEEICDMIKGIAKKYGVSVRGPIPMPTKKLKVTTLKTPCGDGTGRGPASPAVNRRFSGTALRRRDQKNFCPRFHSVFTASCLAYMASGMLKFLMISRAKIAA